MPKNHKSKTHKQDKEIIVKSNHQMNENAVDMNIRQFLFKTSEDSVTLTAYFNNGTDILKGKYLFFYYPSKYFDEGDIHNYVFQLESEFKDVLEIRETLAYLDDEICAIDKIVTDDDRTDRMPFLLRYKKMKRLEKFYNSLIEFSLIVLHDFYWIDITKNKPGPYPLQNRLLKIMPVILQIKLLFENIIHEEFPTDIITENLTQKLYN